MNLLYSLNVSLIHKNKKKRSILQVVVTIIWSILSRPSWGFSLKVLSKRALATGWAPTLPPSARRYTNVSSSTMSFADFCASHKDNNNNCKQLSSATAVQHVCIGNEAGDADSIVSSLALAYMDSFYSPNNTFKIPIVSIPKGDLPLRQETVLLLKLAGLDTHHLDSLVYLDDLTACMRADDSIRVTLVDHNRLTLQDTSWTVMEILDHHFDEQDHPHVKDDDRNIAFDSTTDKALVASTCTLIVERMRSQPTRPPYPWDVSLALLGVILLDTVNLLPAAGKVTERDRQAVETLQRNVDWSQMNNKAAEEFRNDDHKTINTDALYQYLSDSKFDQTFWNNLSAQDALRLDYKQFQASSTGCCFGASSILQPMSAFMSKPRVLEEMQDFITTRKIPLLAVLSMTMTQGGERRRELLLCGEDTKLVRDVSSYLLSEKGSLLQLEEQRLPETRLQPATSSCPLQLRCFAQGNSKASRKQVVPIFLQYSNQS
jgi:exopolyphosphatase